MRITVFLLFTSILSAQLIPTGQPVPKGPNPPVVFINGYQITCSGSDFGSNFGAADKLLQANSIVTLYFDNCSVPLNGSARPTIEAMGAAFGQFLGSLKYTDGGPVAQVDVVVHSMGGLILRSYLSGKQDVSPAKFAPPASTPIRRIVFLSTPHFGSPIASLLGGDIQTAEMSPGSQFLFDLNSWNQGNDDLRGVAALSIAGNGGTGAESKITGFDDGVVSLTSSSLGFYRTGATRLVPYCHTTNSLLTFAGFCSASTPAINNITNDASNIVSQILVSFLTGTNAWQSLGQAAEASTVISATGGVAAQFRDQNDVAQPATGGNITSQTPNVKLTANSISGNVWAEAASTAAAATVQVTPLSGTAQSVTVPLAATTSVPVVVKPGPVISPHGIVPAAGPAPFPYDVAPGAYVSIYGNNLASATTVATIPYPMQIGDVQVLVNGAASQIVFVSSGQINFVYPGSAVGLTRLTVRNAAGQHTVNVRVAPSVPSIFLLDSDATAAARNALTSTVVGRSSPLHAGDFLSLYLTGLGATVTDANGLEKAQVQPTITLGGQKIDILYAGRSPGFAGLDQINCQIPAGITGAAVPVAVTSGTRISNTAFLAIQ